MFDDVDRSLLEWASGVLAGAAVNANANGSVGNGHTASTDPVGATPQVVLDPPGTRTGTRGVSLYLLECVSDPPLRGPGRSPLQVRLRYLVTAWGETPEEAHRLLGMLMFASMDNPPVELEVDLLPLAPETWTALGSTAQPSFVLVVPYKQERPQPQVKYVLKPLVVQTAPLLTVAGTVVGPGDVPLAGAQVEIAGLNMYEQTDERGQFSFRSAPGGPYPIRLRIVAKGRRMEYDVTGQPDAPITIRFDLLDKEK
jgi:hypothetical protein